ncbi:MAG: DUF1588 domain-containing protein [Bryobacterales bacterium]
MLTQGAVLKVTANGTTTSPIVRGAWVTERILGKPVPPSAPNVSAVEPDIRGATTIRQQLEMHRGQRVVRFLPRQDRSARICVETFDAVGSWRTHYRVASRRKVRIGSRGNLSTRSYQMPDGTAFRTTSSV